VLKNSPVSNEMPIISNNTFLFDYFKVFFYIYSEKFMNKFKENNKEKFDKNLLNNLTMNILFKEKYLTELKNNFYDKNQNFLTKEEKNYQKLYMNLIPNNNEQKIKYFKNSINFDNNYDNKISVNNIFYNFSDECLNHKIPNKNINYHKQKIMSNIILNKINTNNIVKNNQIIKNAEIFLKKKTMRDLDISGIKNSPKKIINNNNLKHPIESEKSKKTFNIIKNYDKNNINYYDLNEKKFLNHNNEDKKNL